MHNWVLAFLGALIYPTILLAGSGAAAPVSPGNMVDIPGSAQISINHILWGGLAVYDVTCPWGADVHNIWNLSWLQSAQGLV